MIEDVSFALRPGTLTVILGANGAGKSTALGVLAGDLRPSRGEAMLDGVPLASTRQDARHPPCRRPAAYADEFLTPRARDGRPFAHAVWPGGSRETRSEERASARWSLPHAGRPRLSHAVRRRAAAGPDRPSPGSARPCAASGKPGYLLMDEPTAHLDLKHQILALEAARDFVDAGGGALCILHDMGLAREFSDEVLLMKQGRLVAQGEAGSLLTAPMIAEIYGISDRRAQQFAAS